jgi:hypothetical protein
VTFPLRPREAVIVAELERLLGAKEKPAKASSFEATLQPLDGEEHKHLEGIARLNAAEQAHAEDLRLWEDEAA